MELPFFLSSANVDGVQLEDWTGGPSIEHLKTTATPDPPILLLSKKRNQCSDDFEDINFDPYLAELIRQVIEKEQLGGNPNRGNAPKKKAA